MQTRPRFGAPAENVCEIAELTDSSQADLWVLPELFSTGYLFGSRKELERLAEPIPDGPTCQALLDLARVRGCSFVAGIAEATADGSLCNSAVAVDPTGLRGLYRKVHLFDLEKEWFDPGDLPFPVVTLAEVAVGMMICFDWRFPEAARTLALAGAEVIAHPSNLVQQHCQAAMVTRALENRVYTVTANRIGSEEREGSRLSFTGGSRIVGPDGVVLSEGPPDETGVGIAQIDPTTARVKGVTARNDLMRDRRPEFYRLEG